MNFRDMSASRRWLLIGWLIFFGLVTMSLTQVIHREADSLPTVGAAALAIMLMLGLTGSLYLIYAARQRGYVPGRGGKLVSGLLIFGVVWFIVFLMNTSNAFYWLTSRDALGSDVRGLHHAFEVLEKGTSDHFTNAIDSLKTKAEAAKGAVTREIETPLNPGYNEEAKRRMAEFEAVVRESVKLTSLPASKATRQNVSEYSAMAATAMSAAISNAVRRLDDLRTKAERHTKDDTVQDAREKLDYLLANITNLQASTEVPGRSRLGVQGSSPIPISSTLTAFLERAFVLYRERKDNVEGLMANELLAREEKPKFAPLPATPYSSDLKTVGRIYEPKYWSESIKLPRFWIAIAMGLFADLLLAGWLFFFVLRED